MPAATIGSPCPPPWPRLLLCESPVTVQGMRLRFQVLPRISGDDFDASERSGGLCSTVRRTSASDHLRPVPCPGHRHDAWRVCLPERPSTWTALQTFLDRRAPGRNEWSTPRKEADQPEFLSGLVGNVTCGAPLTAIIRNTNTRSGDYDGLSVVPRPGHADYTAGSEVRRSRRTSPGGGAFFRAADSPAVHRRWHLPAIAEKAGH